MGEGGEGLSTLPPLPQRIIHGPSDPRRRGHDRAPWPGRCKDGDWAACGTLSPLPAAALWLAQLTHAPRAEVFVAGSPDWPFAGEWQGFFDLAQAGRLNLFFLSGAQIDGQGNINLMAIGPYEKPKVRLPGGAGSAILAYVVDRVVLFKTDHSARGLVAAVDTVTAPGYTPELSPWQRPGRITCLVTPKCVFDLSPPQPPQLSQPPPRRDSGGGAPAHGLCLRRARRDSGDPAPGPGGPRTCSTARSKTNWPGPTPTLRRGCKNHYVKSS